MAPVHFPVINGLTGNPVLSITWIPAFAGMTVAIRDFQHPVRTTKSKQTRVQALVPPCGIAERLNTSDNLDTGALEVFPGARTGVKLQSNGVG